MKISRWLLPALLAAAPAHAWESMCYEYTDPTREPTDYPAGTGTSCEPDSGPNTARHRWIGGLDEHRLLFEQSRGRSGLPASVSSTVRLRVFTGNDPIMVGDRQLDSLVPVAFEQATRVQMRSYSIGELSQLPDFSYALWDWASGHESCPLEGVGATAEECHSFATHMGPVNSNHFLPQSGEFYSYYHRLALGRARQCSEMRVAMGDAAPRFASYLQECETEALSIEAVGHHFLQDSWSMGHMWQRWGSTDLADYQGATVAERRGRAVLVALVSGLVHGSRGVLQRLPEWTGLDVNDALCAPHPEVEFIRNDGMRFFGAGDDFLAQLPPFGSNMGLEPQSQRLLSCEASGLVEVYRASGEAHGALTPPSGGMTSVMPTGPECFGQRATNRALVIGAGLQVRLGSNQITLPIDSRVASWMVPNLARFAGEVEVTPVMRAELRVGLIHAMSIARIYAQDSPNGTQIAEGRLGPLLGALPNGGYLGRTLIAPYVDPQLPWPGTADRITPQATQRAEALARMFHRAHVGDWCSVTTAAQLDEMRTRAGNTANDGPTREATCEVCTEMTVRHLRIGTAAAYDTSAEPVCKFLATSPAYVYQPASAGMDDRALARAWCSCAP